MIDSSMLLRPAFLSLFLLLSSCTWESRKPSVLIIGIDSFPFESLNCSETDKNKGFKIICDEMIRFTHAYTPSILTQASLASLFTGKYPFEHGVWNNGSSYLSSKFLTSPEVAVQKGYRTIFVSGGVPVWRRSGVDQGFEVFEDNIPIDFRKYYREASVNVRLLVDWLEKEVQGQSFFSFLFLNDLQFPDFPTVDNEGFPREKTYEGQLREIDETLEMFFLRLKEEKIWNNTWIIVTGMNGLSRDIRLDEAIGTNLFHENTNVGLFIKPPSKEEHPKGSRTIDANVSLVDVGRLLFEILESDFYDTHQTLFKTISLSKFIFENLDQNENRILLFESGWPQWRQFGQTKFALQKDNYLLVYDRIPKLFNTLIDRNQTYPIDYQQGSYQVLTESASQLLSLVNKAGEMDLSQDVIQKFRLSHVFFKKEGWSLDYLPEVELFYKRTKDREVAGWLASAYLDLEYWDQLKSLAEEVKNPDWLWAAAQNLKMFAPEPSICIKLLSEHESIEDEHVFEERCKDSFFISLYSYLKYRGRFERREALIKMYRQFRTDYEIQRLNYQNGYIWDTQNGLIVNPHPIKIILSSPQFARIKKILDQSI